MKNLFNLVPILILFISCQEKSSRDHESVDHQDHQQEESTKKSKSPRTASMTNVGNNHIHIDYSSPSVRNRQIWGGLVAFDEIWSMGAHKATAISFTQNVKINNVELEKGKYALFAIPGENSWTIIINENWDQHLADDYDQSKDLVRIETTPVQNNEIVESLNYKVSSAEDGKGIISMNWEYLSVSFELENLN